MKHLIKSISKSIRDELRWSEKEIRCAIEHKVDCFKLGDIHYHASENHLKNVEQYYNLMASKIAEHRKLHDNVPDEIRFMNEIASEEIGDGMSCIARLKEAYNKISVK